MGLETRKGGGAYYYRKVWQGGRCRSVYVASGDMALLCAFLDQQDREERKGVQPQQNDDQAAAIVVQVDAYCDKVTRTMRAHLEACGYHRHDRGQWRKRRNG